MRKKPKLWIVVALAAPALLAILGMLYQLTIHSDWLAEIPRQLGAVFLVTMVMGAAAALSGAWFLLREKTFSRTERVVVVVAGFTGALYSGTILALHFGLRDGLIDFPFF